MSRRKREHDAAREELREAALFYERSREGWGGVFLDAVGVAIASVLDPTVGWGFYNDRVTVPQLYSRSVHGFPYVLIYVATDDEIFILAYAPTRLSVAVPATGATASRISERVHRPGVRTVATT